MTNLGPVKRAAALNLHMGSVARENCMALSNDQLSCPEGAAKILQVLRNCLAPEEVDSICHEVARFFAFQGYRPNHG